MELKEFKTELVANYFKTPIKKRIRNHYDKKKKKFNELCSIKYDNVLE